MISNSVAIGLIAVNDPWYYYAAAIIGGNFVWSAIAIGTCAAVILAITPSKEEEE